MIDVIVIGGGAGGMMAAYSAASQGAKVLLVERNEKLGKKIYITGKGRCNVTNLCDSKDFLQEVPRNSRFLYSAITAFSPESTIAYLEHHGCKVKVERGNRVFPISEKASDVTKALKSGLDDKKVEVRLHSRVKELMITDGKIKGILLTSGEKIEASSVIIATGGKSYPVTGSDGDGYLFAEQAGHKLHSPLPVLVPLTTDQSWPIELQGLSLKNVRLFGKKGKKIAFDKVGEMVFTHFGFSGPLVLTLSSSIQGEDLANWQFYLDFKPGLTPQQVENRLLRDFDAMPNKKLLTVMYGLLPQRLATVFLNELDIEGESPVNQITKEQRNTIGQGLKNFSFPISGFGDFNEAIVTRGGVHVKEISPGTMESKLVKGLFFAGEVMDVDGYTGGYNLQIAFSTGYLAGQGAAGYLTEK
ncbi:MAG: NAD(P)/FAD-dependent oxidoreductase [Clostridiales bacterium]|nr:NAD(P)/FAD-dependent oxidoreductase [Clostridiales bacterium]